ncbi:hypothetical protein O181_015511 [Austropuccinia psidii MF-1]|uniref:Reverse transcriptase Ty1/copia-type domain-containing protein n=1 Tax=Austropuccinia psidii MF-1 TaxID=1389203 RepID=A0A9Q3GQ64_9BASI|nr:hypothetical protein [Austropuccinia psidii MF-1]
MWKEKLAEVLHQFGFTSSLSNESLFITSNATLMLHIHVDDCSVTGKSEQEIMTFLTSLNKKLKLKLKKNPTQHLGYTIMWNKFKIQLSQTDLILKLLEQNDMKECKPVKTPCNGNFLQEINSIKEPIKTTEYQQSIGSLNYLAQHTRPDIMFNVNQLSRFSTTPSTKHWVELKHLLCYLKGTVNVYLKYTKSTPIHLTSKLTGWADADYGNARDNRKSISGNLVLFFNNSISWLSKKQSLVAQSTTEAGYISINICAKQLQWLTFVLKDLGQNITKPTLFNDNSGAVIIYKKETLNANTKHIEICFQYLRDCVTKKLLAIVQVSSNQMIADILTKPLST